MPPPPQGEVEGLQGLDVERGAASKCPPFVYSIERVTVARRSPFLRLNGAVSPFLLALPSDAMNLAKSYRVNRWCKFSASEQSGCEKCVVCGDGWNQMNGTGFKHYMLGIFSSAGNVD